MVIDLGKFFAELFVVLGGIWMGGALLFVLFLLWNDRLGSGIDKRRDW